MAILIRCLVCPCLLGALLLSCTSVGTDEPFSESDVSRSERLFGLQFTETERDSMMEGLTSQLDAYKRMRERSPGFDVPPALAFNPVPVGMESDTITRPFRQSPVTLPPIPENLEEMAFWSVGQLGSAIRAGKVTSVQLTGMYLERLRRYGPRLECVITLTEDLAMQQARKADEEIGAGKYRGPLHGIPYGAKDLLSTKGIPTTWGTVPYRDQVLQEDAAVIRKLEEAGAVLVAKLTLGALAWGDVWFGGKTRNPWNYEQGSSGSSAGSASATAAGLVPFAIGSETWGSIVSPSTRCGTTGLRPTFGRIARTGAMPLSWSMDKLGPICRTAEDCALVFDAIRGPDGYDQTVRDLPFNYDPMQSISDLRVGYLKADFDSLDKDQELLTASLDVLREMGVELVPIEVPDHSVFDLSVILSAEAAAAFDEFLRDRKSDTMVRQIKSAWPNEFRQSRFIPAVEYIQANRIRHMLIQEMAELMNSIDLYVAPPFGGNLLLTNLTGHPCVVLPCGFRDDGTPASVTFIGQLFGEAELLAFAKNYQDATRFHLRNPELVE